MNPIDVASVQTFERLHIAARREFCVGGLAREGHLLGHGDHRLHAVSWIGSAIEWLTSTLDLRNGGPAAHIWTMSDLHTTGHRTQRSVWLYTFGCKANQYDTE
ncbi:MAG: hypothetical protein OEM23_02640, partial [Gemmatimonadota bacterium]|nr:hypothetical protein [Gemmatimonadota bacterium]